MNCLKIGLFLGFLLLSLVVLACSEDDNNIDGSKLLSGLNASQRYQVCQEHADALNSIVTEEVLCIADGIDEAYFYGGDEAICEQVIEECLESGGGYYLSCIQDEIDEDNLSDCEATVEELRTCTEDWATAWQEVVEDLSCASEGAWEPPWPTSCEPISGTECVDIIEQSFPGNPGSD